MIVQRLNQVRSNYFTRKKYFTEKKSIALYSSTHNLCEVCGVRLGVKRMC